MGRKKNLSEKHQHFYFEEVYRKYFDSLYSYSRVICNSADLAKDVVSDFFYKLWKNQTNLVEINNLEAYLFVSIKNQSIQALSRHLKEMDDERLEIKYLSVEYINPEEIMLEKELRKALDKIISGLPDQCKLVFKLAREKGMKYNEIANELCISKETVKSQLKKAQVKLRRGILNFYLDKDSGDIPDRTLLRSTYNL